ncbi:MAG TPA: cyclic nucleotide-binding domain-containing protein [Methylocystis sp.]|nr:cyclic nucleotide-binding domain-containing protein [Methylocystis sp.]
MAIDAELWTIPLFAAFEPVALQELVASASLRNLKPGEVLFRRGEASDGGFVLTRGVIKLSSREDGRRANEKLVRPVALLGEIALIAPTTRPATGVAQEPSTLFHIRRAQFLLTLENHGATAGRVRELVKDRLEQFAETLRYSTE